MKSFPIYAVLDVSASAMPLIRVYNRLLAELITYLAHQPEIGEAANLSVITFSDDAELILPLTEVGKIGQIRELTSGGRTSYGSAFRLLRERIEIDVDHLKAQGRRVYRPVVIFVTDGLPTDAWEIHYERMTEGLRRPTIIAIGIGEIDVRMLLRIASSPDLAFVGRPGDHGEVIVRAAFNLLAESFMFLLGSTSVSTESPIPNFTAPEGLIQVPEGFRRLWPTDTDSHGE